MKNKLKEAICQGCGCLMDIEGISPFTLCECGNCGTKLVIPLILGDLQLENVTGENCCLNYYVGYDRAYNRDVNIWTLKKDIPDYDKWLEIAQKEAANIEKIKHANINPIIKSEIIDGIFVVTSPKIEGKLLSSYNPDKKEKNDVEKISTYMQIVALAMAMAHNIGITHHSIFPQNIVVDGNNAVIINFFYSRMQYLFETKNGLDPDKPVPYISPERINKNSEKQPADIFSYGMMFYYLLTGKYPFDVYNDEKMALAKPDKITDPVLHTLDDFEDVIDITKHRKDILGPVSEFIMQTIRFSQKLRPGFKEAIEKINLFKAQKEHEKLNAKRRSIVRLPGDDGQMSKTKTFPVLENMAELKKTLQKQKKRNFFQF